MDRCKNFKDRLHKRLVNIVQESQQNIEISGFTSFFIGMTFGITAAQVASIIKR